jgi:predicted Zn finger-like uncharacterized protein
MDVRCEKCRTEYELDESKLKPGGVTVKCTNCGHMFKVRRRITAIGPAVSGPPTLRGGSEPASAPKPSAPAPADPLASGADSDPTWLIRLTDGEILTCRELATLQKWIVAGRVDRDCEISRTGKKWKLLGEIGELASFFEIADEARQVTGAPIRRQPTAGSHPNVVPRQPSGSAPQVVERSPTPAPPPRSPSVAPALAPPSPSRPPAPSQPPIMRDERTTGEWAARAPIVAGETGPSGPTRGLNRPGEYVNGAFIPTDQIGGDDDYFDAPPAGGFGRWIAAISLVVILGGGVAIYFILFQDSEERVEAPAVDAAPVAEPTPDAAPEPQPETTAEIVAAANAALLGDSVAGLEVALGRLGQITGEDADTTVVLIARAKLGAALAQHQIDEAETLESRAAQNRATARARELATAVEKMAIKVLDREPENAAAMVARADALRLRNRPAREVERWLRRALTIESDNREALLSRAELYARDRRPREARKILGELPAIAGDARPVYRLARLDVADESWEDAKKRLAEVLAMEKDHAGAQALAEKVETRLAAAETPDTPETPDRNDDDDDDDDDARLGIDSYDRLLARADKLAESGSCSRAKSYYEKALSANPAGVAALTGLGYCFLDSQQYSSAYAKFRAALGVSSRYQGALWGMAEMYERQGSKSKAIAAYRTFIDAHPSSRRAALARRKIEALGGSSGESGDGGEGGSDGDGAGTGSAADSGGHGSSPTPEPSP